VRVFITYSAADQDLVRELRAHLSPARAHGIVETLRSDEADIVLPIVSVDYLLGRADSAEMTRVLEKGDASVLAVRARAVDLGQSRIGRLPFTPGNGSSVTVTEWRDRDAAWVEVVQDVAALAQRIRQHRTGYQEMVRSLQHQRVGLHRVPTPEEIAGRRPPSAAPGLLGALRDRIDDIRRRFR
jgi:hypothetical protein